MTQTRPSLHIGNVNRSRRSPKTNPRFIFSQKNRKTRVIFHYVIRDWTHWNRVTGDFWTWYKSNGSRVTGNSLWEIIFLDSSILSYTVFPFWSWVIEVELDYSFLRLLRFNRGLTFRCEKRCFLMDVTKKKNMVISSLTF